MLNKIFNIKNKIIIISGGAGLLGSQFASTFSQNGAIPIILDNNLNTLSKLKTKFKKKSLIVMVLTFPNNILVKLTANGVATYNHFHSLKIFEKNRTFENSTHGAFIYTKNSKMEIKGKYPDKKNRKNLIQNFLDSLINKKVKPIISLKEQFDLMNISIMSISL